MNREQEQEFEQLVACQMQKAEGLAMRILHHEQDADDAVQNGVLKAHRAFLQWRREAPFGTWFCRIVIHVALAHRRTATYLRAQTMVDIHQLSSRDEHFLAESVSQPSREEALDRQILLQMVEAAIKEMRPIDRHLIALRYVKGLNDAQTGAQLGLTEAAIGSRLFHIRKGLRKRFANHPRARALFVGQLFASELLMIFSSFFVK
ncbi:sigma-70 family RNA polymerase sigma factor [Candidatus Uhrbacteria bacterium]|nr:sigma-70 family RNA polymerase sigma factor [Candidatus Uhrbacteria bacterium]